MNRATIAFLSVAALFAVACGGKDASSAPDESAQDLSAAGTHPKLVFLKSQDGAALTISYLPIDPAGDTEIDAQVTVQLHTRLGSDCGAATRAVLVTRCGQPPPFETTSQVDLVRQVSDSGAGCFFENAGAAKILIATHAGVCKQEIAVVSGGKWLVDPVNGTHNFQYTMTPL